MTNYTHRYVSRVCLANNFPGREAMLFEDNVLRKNREKKNLTFLNQEGKEFPPEVRTPILDSFRKKKENLV